MALQRCLLLLITLIVLPGMITLAQQPQTPAPEGNRTDLSKSTDVRDAHRRHGFGLERWGQDLNLTDEQQKQIRAIVQRRNDATKAQREELFSLREKRRSGTFGAEDEARAQTLRQEVRDSMKGIRDEINTVLTSDQRAKLEAREQERKSRHELRRRSRQEPPNDDQ